MLRAPGVGGEEDGGEVGAGEHGEHAGGDRHRARPGRVRGRAGRATSTSPAAIPPSTVPRKKGRITEESAKTAPSTRASLIVAAWPRRAKAVPRMMIPSAARKSGTRKVVNTAPKTSGNAVHAITSTKISQTWLASHTGLIERWTSPRTGPPRAVAAGREVPEAGAEVGAAEHGVHGQAEEDEREADLGHQRVHLLRARRGDVRGEPAQQPRDGDGQQQVDRDEHREAEPRARRCS